MVFTEPTYTVCKDTQCNCSKCVLHQSCLRLYLFHHILSQSHWLLSLKRLVMLLIHRISGWACTFHYHILHYIVCLSRCCYDFMHKQFLWNFCYAQNLCSSLTLTVFVCRQFFVNLAPVSHTGMIFLKWRGMICKVKIFNFIVGHDSDIFKRRV